MKKYTFFFILLLFIIFNCSKNEDKKEDNHIMSLQWTEDTIKFDFKGDYKCIKFIWASSPDDIYIGGYTIKLYDELLYVNEVKEYILLHYDGNSWNKIDLQYSNKSIPLYSISGSSKDNIYILSNFYDKLIHYNGTNWEFVYVGGKSDIDYTSKFYGPYDFVHCTAPNNLWTGKGSNLIHYDGENWEVITLKEVEEKIHLPEFKTNKNFFVSNKNGECYLAISLKYYNGNNYSFLYKKQGEQWKLIKNEPLIYSKIWLTNSGKLYCLIPELGLAILKNQKWDYLFYYYETNQYYYNLYNITKDDEIFMSKINIFLDSTKLYYYNSGKWEFITNLKTILDYLLLKTEDEYWIVSNLDQIAIYNGSWIVSNLDQIIIYHGK